MDEQKKPSTDRLIRALTLDGCVRVLAVRAREVAADVQRRHGLGADAARLAAEGVVANLLLSAHVKGEERVLMEMAGDDGAFTYSGEAWADGGVRAKLQPPEISPGHLRGRLVAVRWDDRREIYRGINRIDHERLELALEAFMLQSQQTRGVIRIEGADGLLVEMMPDALPEEFDAQAEALRRRPLAEVLAALDSAGEGGRVEGLTDLPLELLQIRPLCFRCTCALERVEGALLAMGAEEILSLMREEGRAEATCHFCNERYVIDAEGLRVLALHAQALLMKPAQS